MPISPRHAAAALVVASLGAGAAGAQVAQASGTVTLKQAEGGALPLSGATVDIYRTDIKGRYWVKTDGKGRYLHHGLPLVGTYTLVFSAPGAQPAVFNGCRFGDSELNAVLEPGDGRRPSPDEVRTEDERPCAAAAGEPGSDGPSRVTETVSATVPHQGRTLDLASLYAAGRFDQTISESREILAVRDDIEASLYLGLALLAAGNRENLQEAADHLTRFVERAPDTDARKATAQSGLEQLRSLGVVGRAPATPPKPGRRRS